MFSEKFIIYYLKLTAKAGVKEQQQFGGFAIVFFYDFILHHALAWCLKRKDISSA